MERIKNILCVVVPNLDNKIALGRAVDLATNNQSSLTVIGVIDVYVNDLNRRDGAYLPSGLQEVFAEEHRQKLEQLVAPWKNDVEIQVNVLSGTPFLNIIHEVLRNGRDLVIKVAENTGLLDRVFGSNDMHLLRKCPCPIWLLKPEATKSYRRILAAVDVDDDYPSDDLKTRQELNRQILEMASSLALSEFAELHIVCVWEAFAESAMRGGFMKKAAHEVDVYVEDVRQKQQKLLSQLVEGVISNLGRETEEFIKPKTHLVKGYPQQEISSLAKDIEAELVVMGTVARTGISGFIMGNTAETILNRLDCSVLAIKPPGFKTPVTLED